ncbi:MAG: mechanosensitive ion channel family protein [Methylocystis sp.]
MSDLFSGLVLSLSRPYGPGDWISVEGGTEGRVVEMNWRATHVLTSRKDLAIVPNSIIAKSKIVNETFPTSIHGISVAVQLDSETAPASGIGILELAILNCMTISAAPSPTIRVASIDAARTRYELTFFIEKHELETAARNELFDHVYRHVTASGARLASPENGSSQAYDGKASSITPMGPQRALDLTALFASLTSEERKAIASKLKYAFYEAGETLVEPGSPLHSLFIVGNGVLSVKQCRDGDGETEVLRFGPGDYFGEVSLLTGSCCHASISALAHSAVYELTKSDLAPILESSPQVAQDLSRALAQRQAAGRAFASTGVDNIQPRRGLSIWFSERIHELFKLRDDAEGG